MALSIVRQLRYVRFFSAGEIFVLYAATWCSRTLNLLGSDSQILVQELGSQICTIGPHESVAWTSQAMGQNDEEFISEKACVIENR